MTFGLQVARANGQVTVNRTLPGGRLLAGVITQAPQTVGTQTVFTYPDVASGADLRVYQVGSGPHNWVTGTNGSAQATVTLTATDRKTGLFQFNGSTLLLVFTTTTREPSFGVLLTNDAGERTISGVYPSAEYIGRVSVGGFTDLGAIAVPSGYNRFQATGTAPGGGRQRLVLWSVPAVTADHWYNGTSYLSAGNSTVTLSACAPSGTAAGSIASAQGFVFAIDGFASSGDAFGIRAFNASGGLTFDGGWQQFIVNGFGAVSYETTAPGSVLTFATPALAGIGTPAILTPLSQLERWQGSPVTTGRRMLGHIRRPAGTNDLQTRLVQMQQFQEDVGLNAFYEYGRLTNAPIVVIDAANHP